MKKILLLLVIIIAVCFITCEDKGNPKNQNNPNNPNTSDNTDNSSNTDNQGNTDNSGNTDNQNNTDNQGNLDNQNTDDKTITLGQDDFIAYFVETPPVIDGDGSDPAWAKAKWQDIKYAWMYQASPYSLPTGATAPTPVGGAIEKTPDFSGRFKVVWTADRLYILAEIIDDQIKTPNTGNVYQNPENNDCLEIFISESASTSTQPRGTTANSTSHFFAYHMNFTDMVSVLDYIGGSNSSSDPNTRIENGFIKRNHHLNFKIGKNDSTHTYIWETEMKVYGNDYPVITSPEDRMPVILTKNKKMGFAIAYNDNDTTKRDHFIGSMYVQGNSDDARNQGYKNASVYAKLYLVK